MDGKGCLFGKIQGDNRTVLIQILGCKKKKKKQKKEQTGKAFYCQITH